MLGIFALLFCARSFAPPSIPEIENLKNGALIPAAVYQNYTSREIGEAVVQRLTKSLKDPTGKEDFHELGPPTKVPFDPVSQSEIQLYFPAENVEKIVSTNSFLNLHQVPSIQGYDTRTTFRDQIEQSLARLRLSKEKSNDPDSPVNKLRPKSAVLEFRLPADQMPVTRGGKRFGELVAVLKDDVKRRTTYTPYDSGAIFSSPYTTADRLRKEVRPLLASDYFFRPLHPSEYFEAQVWGELSLSDVKEFLVPKGFGGDALSKLRETGIPIFQYVEVKVGKEKNGYHENYHRRKGRLLFPGAATPCPDLYRGVLEPSTSPQ